MKRWWAYFWLCLWISLSPYIFLTTWSKQLMFANKLIIVINTNSSYLLVWPQLIWHHRFDYNLHYYFQFKCPSVLKNLELPFQIIHLNSCSTSSSSSSTPLSTINNPFSWWELFPNWLPFSKIRANRPSSSSRRPRYCVSEVVHHLSDNPGRGGGLWELEVGDLSNFEKRMPIQSQVVIHHKGNRLL